MIKHIINTIIVYAALTIITGILYPMAVTGLAQFFFPYQANGSMIKINEKAIGSELIGQNFSDPKYFWSRPSATTPAYNSAASSGSNLGPLNPDLTDVVKKRIELLQIADPDNKTLVPIDLVTTSGSGLDPHVSPASAYYQLKRISKIRGIDENQIQALINQSIEKRQWGILGEPRINVLQLNLKLDELKNKVTF